MGGAGVLNLQLIVLFSSGSTPYVAVSTYVLTLLQSLTKLQIHHNLSLFWKVNPFFLISAGVTVIWWQILWRIISLVQSINQRLY